jgi:hypothetical protein
MSLTSSGLTGSPSLPSLPIPERASEGIAQRPQLLGQRDCEKLVVISLDV